MEKVELEALTKEAALLICKGFHWGEHLADERETLQVARSVVSLVVERLSALSTELPQEDLEVSRGP